MRVAFRDNDKVPRVSALPFSETEHRAYTASGRADKTQGWWKVKVHADGYKIIRDVSYEGEPWDLNQGGWQLEAVIWPAWPARLEDQAPLGDSPLAGAQDYWAKVGSRLRDSAKWMATVLGAAPCGVTCLTSLRQSMVIEEVTLALARASARDEEASGILRQAEAARAARLMELRAACAKIATIGEYYKLRARSTRVTYGGIICSFAGTVAIIAALTGLIHVACQRDGTGVFP